MDRGASSLDLDSGGASDGLSGVGVQVRSRRWIMLQCNQYNGACELQLSNNEMSEGQDACLRVCSTGGRIHVGARYIFGQFRARLACGNVESYASDLPS